MTAPAPSPSIIRLDETPSTNTWLARHPEREDMPHGTTVIARCQSAGRGQRGNSWEAAPGQNVTMSMLLRPRSIEARCQFVISEVVSVAMVELCRELLGDNGATVTVKWPNDIYIGDNKVAGILIEHTLAGTSILSTVAGIGLNVNQEQFLSDAPNPVSLYQVTGRKLDIDSVAKRLAGRVLQLMDLYDNPDHYDELHTRYLSMLWRRDTLSPYRDTATGELFCATIADVEPTGILHLRLPGETHQAPSSERTYAFKEVSFIL